jgi:hypothetical protein
LEGPHQRLQQRPPQVVYHVEETLDGFDLDRHHFVRARGLQLVHPLEELVGFGVVLDVQVEDLLSQLEEGVDVLPGPAEGLRHGGVDLGSGPLRRDQLVRLAEQLLDGALFVLQ